MMAGARRYNFTPPKRIWHGQHQLTLPFAATLPAMARFRGTGLSGQHYKRKRFGACYIFCDEEIVLRPHKYTTAHAYFQLSLSVKGQGRQLLWRWRVRQYAFSELKSACRLFYGFFFRCAIDIISE